jgi:NAD(P)-dependent dehydrogenase (short-subunit alcohol dehydrogenase family)
MFKSRLKDRVVVITGASSGIGRASAMAFAEADAKVAVAARRSEALDELVGVIRASGGRAIAVPLDVTDEEAVTGLARRAVDEYGRIDVWVNNAAVSAFGRAEQLPTEVFRRVMDVNVNGYVYGARAAIRQFREQGAGTLVNVSSMLGKGGAPFLSAYVMSKFAIIGLSESLRQELLDEKEIRVSTVLPASIDTPIFQHAANFTGRAIKPLEPIYDADKVAGAILEAARTGKREVYAGAPAKLGASLHNVVPQLYEPMMARNVDNDHFQDRYDDPTTGNLFEPMPEHAGASGGWKEPNGTGRGRLLAAAVVAGAIGLAGWRLARPSVMRARR